MAEMQSLLTQLEEFGTKTVRLGATHRFRRTGSDVGNAPVAGGTTRLAKVDDHSSELEPNKPSLDVVLSKSPAPHVCYAAHGRSFKGSWLLCVTALC